MRSGLCVELSRHGESKSENVTSVQHACFNVEALIEIKGFKIGPKRSHVALRNLRIERCKNRSPSSSKPFLSSDFKLALVFDKPGQYILPISEITHIRCKYLQQGRASIETKGSLILLTAVTQGDLERLLLFIRDVKAGKTLLESQSCVVCREKRLKAKHKREELQSSDNSQTSKQDGDCQATKKQKTEVLDCIFRKRQLLHVNAGKQLRDLKNREQGHKSKKMDIPPTENENQPDVIDREVYEPNSKVNHMSQERMRHQCGRENSASGRSPPGYSSRSKDGQDSRSTSLTFTRAQLDERSLRVAENVRTWERPGTWSGRSRERESLSPEGEKEKENFKSEEEVRRIGEETVRRLAEERRRVEEEKRRVFEEQRSRVEEEHRRVLEEQRKKYEDERRRREEVKRLEEEERRHAEERERISQDETRRREEKERQTEELKEFVEKQERKRKEEKERRALEEERRRKEVEDRILQELWRYKHEEERLRKELERRIQEQEQLRKQEEERRRKHEEERRRKEVEDQRFLELMRQKDEEERVKREQERRLQEQVLEVKPRQEEENKKQQALRGQRQEDERLLQEMRKEELRRQKHDVQSKRGSEEERRRRQDSAAAQIWEDLKMRMLMEEERKKEEENRRRGLGKQREEQVRLDEEMRQWQREEDQRRSKEDKWNMSDEERTRLEEQRRRVEEVMKMTRGLARTRLQETVKEVERRRQAPAQEERNEKFCRKFADEEKRTLDEDIQELVNKARNVGSLEEVLVNLGERCTFRSDRVASGNVGKETPNSYHSHGMSYLFTRLEEKNKVLKEEQERTGKEETRLNVKPDNSADFQAKAEKQNQEFKRHEVERKRAKTAANTLKKKLLQEQPRAAKLEARRQERTRKKAEKQAEEEDRATQQQKAHEQTRKQAQEQAKQQHYPSAPQRWPSYNHRPLTYQEYEESWDVLKISREGSTLGYADIPWPPAGNPLFIESGDSVDVQRRKLRIALLRWHPDKFMAICEDRLGSIDRESIETQAKHLAQQVIQWKGRLEQA